MNVRPLGTGVAAICLAVGLLPVDTTAQGGSSDETLTVTTASDAMDGDVASVSALKATPGSDGISLREAIQATDNDPGAYAVGFDPSLKGATILVGATCCGSLPALTGGGVSIDGDIDGDGHPDVTLADGSGGIASFGLDVVSSGNLLHALTLQGFPNGVLFTASPSGQGVLPTGQTFVGNVVSGLVITGSTYGGIRIWPIGPDPGHPECMNSACQMGNQWTDTQIIGNTIESGFLSGGKAIGVDLDGSVGDVVQRLTIDGNVISMASTQVDGITLHAGTGGGADDNHIADVVVEHNVIEGEAPSIGVDVLSGRWGGSSNVVEDLTISDNHVRFSGSPGPGDVAPGTSLGISDGSGPPGCTASCPIPSRNNVERHIRIVGNVFEGSAPGVASDPCCGGPTSSRLSDLTIARNTITGSIARQDLNPWGIEIGTGSAATSNVVVSGNTIVQRAPGARSGYRADLAGGGIAVIGGLGRTRFLVRDVLISGNRLDTPLLGITIVGGGPRDIAPAGDTIGNRVFGVRLRANTIVRSPVLATRWNRKVKGITVIGGLGGSRPSRGRWRRSVLNSVKCIRLKGNTVVGKRDEVAVFANLGAGASRNTARLGGC